MSVRFPHFSPLFSSARCVILAAGMATRLRPLTDSTPKSLLPIAGVPILQRLIQALRLFGAKDIAVVTGYMHSQILEYITSSAYEDVTVLVNKEYASTNNAFSLLQAESFVCRSHSSFSAPLLLLDGDLVFEHSVLLSFQEVLAENTLAIRSLGNHNEEEVKVKISQTGSLVQIGKEIPLEESAGESVGIAWFLSDTVRRLFEILHERIEKQNGKSEFYESAFQQLIDEGVCIKALDVGSKRILEIDTPEDYHAAQGLFGFENGDQNFPLT